MLMFRPPSIAAALLLAVMSSNAPLDGRQSTTPAAPDVTTLGPQIGEQVPEFSLSDQAGRRQTLRSLMGKDGLVLVFYRSADW